MKSQTFIQSQNQIAPLVPVSVMHAQIVEASESPVGNGPQDQCQPFDPVTEFKLWLANATKPELEEAEHRCEENVLGCYRNGSEWRLAMGQHLYEHRELVKKRGSRDWTRWVTDTLDLGRTTAYDLMRAYVQEYGHTIAEHDEPDQPNAKADEIKESVVKAKEKRKGRLRAPAAPQVDGHVRVPLPEMFVTREECDLFKEARERNEEGVYRIYRAAFYVVIGKADPEAELGADDGVGSVPARVEGEEATNDPISN